MDRGGEINSAADQISRRNISNRIWHLFQRASVGLAHTKDFFLTLFLRLLSAIRNRRKFPKKELIFKNLDSELAHIRNDNLYHQYWNATTHPHVRSLFGILTL